MRVPKQRGRYPEIIDFQNSLESEPAAPPAALVRSRRLIQMVVGRWYWVALGLILGLGCGVYFLSKAPKVYSATATLLVKQKGSTVLLSGKDMQEELDMRSSDAMNTVAAQLKRRSLLEKVAARPELREMEGLIPQPVVWTPGWLRPWLGESAADAVVDAAPKVPNPEELATRMETWITVTVRRNTRLVDLKVQHRNPEVARQLADVILQEYVSEGTETRSDGRLNSIALLKVESDRARADLQSAQRSLGGYQQALKMQVDMEQREIETTELAKRYLPQHPKMITAQARYDDLKKNLFVELERLRKSGTDAGFWQTAEAEWKVFEGDSDEARLAAGRRILLSRTAVLESEIRSQESVFNAILTKLQETDVNQAASKTTAESECEVSNRAVVPEKPDSPVPAMALGLGFAGGGVVGLGLALALSLADNKFRTVSQLAAVTGVPVLAAVAALDPALVERQIAKRDAKRKGADSTTSEPDYEKEWDRRLVFRHGLSTSQHAEMYRVLRASVSLLGDETVRKVILFSSALPGEGKTLTSVNFALAAAAQGKSVLLIDLDLRKPAVHRSFGLKQDVHKYGMTELLAGRCRIEHAIYRSAGPKGLDLILSGARAPSPGELLNTGNLSVILAEARLLYDVVVLDTAPLLAVPDTRVVGPLADTSCLVVRAEQTPIGAVLAAIELLDAGETPIAGLIFNGYTAKRRVSGYSYYSSYGGYRSYGGYGAAGQYGYGQEDDQT